MIAKSVRAAAAVVFAIAGLLCAKQLVRAQSPDYTITGTGNWTVGVSTDWGGAITYIAQLSDPNIVNNGLPDTGRSVQISLYNAGETYSNGWPCGGGVWGWNPVQAGTMTAGSCVVSGSGVNSVSADSSHIYTNTTPYHWNPNLGRSNVTVEQTVQFQSGYGNVIRVDYTITNNESFTVSNGSAGHEAPVAYINNTYGYATAYNGASPWTNDALSLVGDGDPGSTEPWVALLNNDPTIDPTRAYGIGLYVADYPSGSHFNFGSVSGATAMQSWRNLTISPGGSASFSVYLVLGRMSNIRSTIYSLAGH